MVRFHHAMCKVRVTLLPERLTEKQYGLEKKRMAGEHLKMLTGEIPKDSISLLSATGQTLVTTFQSNL